MNTFERENYCNNVEIIVELLNCSIVINRSSDNLLIYTSRLCVLAVSI